jgi:hypothetical protein
MREEKKKVQLIGSMNDIITHVRWVKPLYEWYMYAENVRRILYVHITVIG